MSKMSSKLAGMHSQKFLDFYPYVIYRTKLFKNSTPVVCVGILNSIVPPSLEVPHITQERRR